MRGKRVPGAFLIGRMRITPADAGKTYLFGRAAIRNTDHPRGCGENFCFRNFVIIRGGSPPRMRGKLNNGSVAVIPPRITPADAGKTFQRAQTSTFMTDHPRGCGENWVDPRKKLTKRGSPPRMRGKLAMLVSMPKPARITPADAGKT